MIAESKTLKRLEAVFSRNFFRLNTVAIIIATNIKDIKISSERYLTLIKPPNIG